MASELGGPLLTFIRRLAASSGSDQADSELLRRFAVGREESAFAGLMHRHGPMVLGVCQSVLQDTQDAEDAFQATFLVLARRAGAIRKPGSVASWLHGVAYRLAMRARVEAARRRTHERQAVPMPRCEPRDEILWRDLRPVLHEEVARLPERYRLPFVLCYLEGKTNEEAADLLGIPKGTILSRLSRGRERLSRRLTRRGLGITSGLLAGLLAQNADTAAVPAALAEGTLRAALLFAVAPGAVGSIAVPALVYAEGMLRAAFVAKLKLGTVALLAVALAGAGAVLVEQRRTSAGADAPSIQPPAPAALEASPPKTLAPVLGERGNRIQGTWTVTAAEQYGRKIDTLTNRRFIFTADRYTLTAGGEIPSIFPSAALAGDLILDPKNPGQIDLDAQRWRHQGIYAIDGENLRICLSANNSEQRPTELATKAGSSHLLLILQRQ